MIKKARGFKCLLIKCAVRSPAGSLTAHFIEGVASLLKYSLCFSCEELAGDELEKQKKNKKCAFYCVSIFIGLWCSLFFDGGVVEGIKKEKNA